MQIFGPDDTQTLHLQVSEYTRLLSRLVRNAKACECTPKRLFESLFFLLGESLCYRDELDEYLEERDQGSSKSILNCQSLESYQDLYDELSAGVHSVLAVSSHDTSLRDDGAQFSNSVGNLLSFGIRTFGSGQESSNRSECWSKMCLAYFGSDCDPVELFSKYYSSLVCDVSAPDTPWTLDEDYTVVSESERFGPTIHAVHSIFIALGEMRTFDEIQRRVCIYFPMKPRARRRKTRKKQEESCDVVSLSSGWSCDDELLATTPSLLKLEF